jgi:hypothetical protein
MVFESRGNARTPGPLGQVPSALGGRVPGPLRSGPKDDPGKGKTATQSSKATPPDQADGTSDALNERVAKAAEGYVGKPVVGSGECYDAAVAIAKAAGAKSAADFDKITGSRDQDYRWGKPITLDQVKRGDQLQFRNHKIVIETTITVTKGGKVIEKRPKPSIETYSRVPQHSATVIAVNPDGSFTVVEQHVLNRATGNLSDTVKGDNRVYTKNTTLQERKTRTENDVEIVTTIEKKITVTGKIMPYRPQEDPKHKKDLDFQ